MPNVVIALDNRPAIVEGTLLGSGPEETLYIDVCSDLFLIILHFICED